MERSLGLMCGAGVLPARMADAARRQGWRVVAFVFDGASDIRLQADRTIRSRLTEAAAVLSELQRERVTAAAFSGKFSMSDVLRARPDDADAAARGLTERAGSRVDATLVRAIIATLAGIGIEVLDQRVLLGELLGAAGCWTKRSPSDAEWRDIRRGLTVARTLADAHIGQTVVLRHGAVTAVEAVEGTTETVRRGTALGGPGAVIVKGVARDHDYRFDMPTIGRETIEAAATGGATVVALEAGRVLLLDKEASVRSADGAGIAVVAVDDGT